ncbi:TetR family transcriptional regulator [Streptomyces luomodiensis]|uniref:TetR family transcriptional regulator n=1 Tax=Streptomyces luomodiensis TaxID=3026192 RepID=A0ABY9V7P3_9ACTN|nr:TetR family transcriptional regulator [Streptomyces sp. SCA4-21]WNE99899.1 TetR family transcriptional regulator [Streptomyces sp. SCA4-21]
MRSGPALDAETILTATEEVLRRHGPAKATVLDVARALGVSHASVYRHFPSKAALREAVARRWLGRAREPLAAVAADTRQAAPERLRTWLTTLFTAKRHLMSDDPELFATYRVLVAEHSSAFADHVDGLVEQLRVIIADGVGSGDFTSPDPAATARTVFAATMAYHHPAHAPEWQAPEAEAALEAVCALLINGLRPR